MVKIWFCHVIRGISNTIALIHPPMRLSHYLLQEKTGSTTSILRTCVILDILCISQTKSVSSIGIDPIDMVEIYNLRVGYILLKRCA